MSVRILHAILGAAVLAWAGSAAARDPDDLYGPEYEAQQSVPNEVEDFDSYVADPDDSYIVEQPSSHEADVAEARSAAPRASGPRSSETCSQFRETVTVRGEPQAVYGTACEQPDGSWKIISAPGLADAFEQADDTPPRPVPTYAYNADDYRRAPSVEYWTPAPEPRYRSYADAYYPSYRPTPAWGGLSLSGSYRTHSASPSYRDEPRRSYSPARNGGWLKRYTQRKRHDKYGR